MKVLHVIEDGYEGITYNLAYVLNGFHSNLNFEMIRNNVC